MASISRISIFFIGLIVVVSAGFYFLQEQLIFYPSKLAKDYSFNFNNDFQEKWLSFNGIEIHSLLFEVKGAPGVILYFHGNAGSMEGWGELGSEIADQTGWSTWMIDYPGYGKSTGAISSEEQLHELAAKMLTEVRTNFPQQKVVVYGRSLGTGLASKLASNHIVDGVVLETPYFNGTELAKVTFPFMPAFIVRYTFLSNQWVKNIKSPTLIVHGTEDEIVPYDHGLRIYNEISSNKELLSIKGGFHNNLPEYQEYWSGLKAFLNRL